MKLKKKENSLLSRLIKISDLPLWKLITIFNGAWPTTSTKLTRTRTIRDGRSYFKWKNFWFICTHFIDDSKATITNQAYTFFIREYLGFKDEANGVTWKNRNITFPYFYMMPKCCFLYSSIFQYTIWYIQVVFSVVFPVILSSCTLLALVTQFIYLLWRNI